MRTLTYHDVAAREQRESVGLQGPLAARYKLDPGDFAAHLDAIARAGLRVAPLHDERALGEDAVAPQVLLSFDDGGASALLVAEMLELRGWRGSFFIITGRIGSEGFLTAEQLRELARRGHIVGAHSHSHPTYMGKLTRAQLDDEWRRSRALLEEVLGAPPRSASVPGGYLSRAVVAAAAAAGYEVLFTSEPTARARQDGLLVRGRYTIWSTTPASTAAAYARGARGAAARLWLEWNAKKVAKSVSPSAYQALRRVRARRS
jgi:peptidoglycan/xylan/chitin deacetylase (PgdA/CDA1 family)